MGDKPKIFTLPGDYEHKGATYPSFFNRRMIESPETLDCRPDDVFVASYPKSGTTVTVEMVNLLMNGGDVEASRTTPQTLRAPMVEIYLQLPFMVKILMWFLQAIKMVLPGFLKQYVKGPSKDEMAVMNGLGLVDSLPSPRLIKTHLPYNTFPTQALQKKCKIVYVARNPKDVVYSYYHHNKIMPNAGPPSYKGPFDLYFETYLQGKVWYGDWFDHVLDWWKHKDDHNILFVKYEDLKKDPRAYLRKIAVFLDVNLTEDMEDKIIAYCSVKSMKQNAAVNNAHMTINKDKNEGFVRKGIVGDWMKRLTVDQNMRLEQKYEERMKGSGLDFEW